MVDFCGIEEGDPVKICWQYVLGLFVACALGASAATLDGMKIHSAVAGTGPKTVILVHGWTCDSTSWSEQIPALEKKYRVVTLDLPGHGKSDAPKDGKYSMELFARAIESVRAETKADRVVLVGHSMGTPVIVEYARLYPQHTAALVFADGVTPGITPPAAAGTAPGHPGDAMQGPDGRKNREAMINGLFTPQTSPAIQAKVRAMMLTPSDATAAGAMNATFDPGGQFTSGTIDVPVLAIYAGHSRLENPDYLHAHYTHVEITKIPGTGHFLMLEKPDAFNKLVADFLAKQNF
jgi:pimeloyl-ACP methyl ester carboxylesterase